MEEVRYLFFFFCLLLSVLSEFHYGFGLSKNAHACSRSLQFSRICFIWALCVHSPFDRCTVQIKKVNARSIWILCLFIRFCVNVAIWLHKLKKKKNNKHFVWHRKRARGLDNSTKKNIFVYLWKLLDWLLSFVNIVIFFSVYFRCCCCCDSP